MKDPKDKETLDWGDSAKEPSVLQYVQKIFPEADTISRRLGRNEYVTMTDCVHYKGHNFWFYQHALESNKEAALKLVSTIAKFVMEDFSNLIFIDGEQQ